MRRFRQSGCRFILLSVDELDEYSAYRTFAVVAVLTPWLT